MTTSPELPLNFIDLIKNYLLQLQDSICNTLTECDAHKPFLFDEWSRAQGGGGISRVLEGGSVFEKAGVNLSHVCGDTLPSSASAYRPQLYGRCFQALGVSLVIHPRNPFVPSSHANVRFFIATNDSDPPVWWFGGGFDLTPYYGFAEDCIHWHREAKKACDPFGKTLYKRFKKWCDEYFYLKHRQEARGIGGLFFDDYCDHSFEQSFSLMRSIGDAYLKAYMPIVERRMHLPYGKRERNFQLFRRGRYAEFNLIYDRGTLFGLQSGGRTESILMSLPPEVRWAYNWHPKLDTPEIELYQTFLPARDWLG